MHTIDSIRVTKPSGITKSAIEAIDIIESFDEAHAETPLLRYEVDLRYTSGDEIRGRFIDKASAMEFLKRHQLG